MALPHAAIMWHVLVVTLVSRIECANRIPSRSCGITQSAWFSYNESYCGSGREHALKLASISEEVLLLLLDGGISLSSTRRRVEAHTFVGWLIGARNSIAMIMEC